MTAKDRVRVVLGAHGPVGYAAIMKETGLDRGNVKMALARLKADDELHVTDDGAHAKLYRLLTPKERELRREPLPIDLLERIWRPVREAA